MHDHFITRSYELLHVSRVNKNYIVKSELINMTRAWDKEKYESPTGIEPMTELRELMENKVMCDRPPAYC